MKMFDAVKGYATPANAEKKLRKALGDDLGEYDWIIGTTSEGRYIPVILRHRGGLPNGHLIHFGLCVAG